LEEAVRTGGTHRLSSLCVFTVFASLESLPQLEQHLASLGMIRQTENATGQDKTAVEQY
jgi:hypothetical protein